jgi:aromatic-L-amino-acid decarboxylase
MTRERTLPSADDSGHSSDLDTAQIDGLYDMDADSFRAAAHAAVDVMADYLEGVRDRPVMPNVEPGTIGPLFEQAPPEKPEAMAAILADYQRLFEPNVTHWQHPRFLAYFGSSASGPGIVGEMLTSVLNSNPMLWRTSPAGTELEQVVIDWIRQALGLPDDFDGLINDTASTSSMLAIAAARQAAGLDVAAQGLPARKDVPALRVYCSEEAHSSIEKGAMTLGLGRAAVRKIATNERFELRIDALEAAIAADKAAGIRPIALVGTIGTTSTTSADPIREMARIARREGMWLHVDAAYAGVVAIIPERRAPFDGWELADSIVTNAHKWWFVPVDASILLTRRMPVLRDAFSLVPEYLRTLDREGPIRDYNEYTPTLGRRLRSLKLWIHLRYFGLEGLRRRVEHHIAMAGRLAGWVDAEPDFERMAPVPFSTVCLRYRPAEFAGRDGEPGVDEQVDDLNVRLMDAVNRTGKAFLSHTKVNGHIVIRVAISNLRTEDADLELVWDVIRREAAALTTR